VLKDLIAGFESGEGCGGNIRGIIPRTVQLQTMSGTVIFE
jgi:hypothetical protein